MSKLTAIFRRITGLQFSGAYIQTAKLLKLLKKENPTVVHLHCINGNNINVYRLLRFLATNKIPTVFTLHAEFPYTGGCSHAYECEKWKTECKKCSVAKKEIKSLFFDCSPE